MKLRKPSYFDQFHCIGSACSDTCCANWEIEVDEEAAKRYASFSGEMGAKLQRYMVTEENEVYFAMGENRRCPFLNQQNLCELILEFGEDVLCDICREHPRHYEWFGDYTEVGLGLCCEEAGRLLLSREEPLTFQLEEAENTPNTGNEAEDADEKAYIERFLQARETAYAIVQNREMSIANRLTLLMQYGEELQESLDMDDFETMERSIGIYRNQAATAAAWQQMLRICGAPERNAKGICSLQELLRIYSELEALNPDWHESLQRMSGQLDVLLEQTGEFQKNYKQAERDYENITVYFLYRYFMEALFDGDILGKIKFAVMSILVCYVMDLYEYEGKRASAGKQEKIDRAFTLADHLTVIRRYSKEVEYCTENMELLGQLCWEEACMSTDEIVSMLTLL